MTKDEAQHRSLDPVSAGRWTFYEAVKIIRHGKKIRITLDVAEELIKEIARSCFFD